MRFSFVTLFPNLIKGYFSESILKRAIEDKKLSIDFADYLHNLLYIYYYQQLAVSTLIGFLLG